MQLIAIGNGTASRETDQLAADLINGWERGDQGGRQRSQAHRCNTPRANTHRRRLPDLDVGCVAR